jgi:hypothetical protein
LQATLAATLLTILVNNGLWPAWVATQLWLVQVYSSCACSIGRLLFYNSQHYRQLLPPIITANYHRYQNQTNCPLIRLPAKFILLGANTIEFELRAWHSATISIGWESIIWEIDVNRCIGVRKDLVERDNDFSRR